jgi:hypothetical protein
MTRRSTSTDQPVLLRYRQKSAEQDDFVVASDHAQEQLLAGRAVGEGHDGLGVQDEPVLVDRVADASEPREGVELSLAAACSFFSSVMSRKTTTAPWRVGPLRSGAEE